MSTVRLSHSLRLDRMVRYCLLASLVLALFAGLPAAQVYARPLLASIYTQTVELTSAGTQSLGAPIAISGDTVVLGAPKGDKVYVYNRLQSGEWDTTNVAILTDPNGTGHQFGYAVAIEDDTIVVGAPYDDTLAKDRGAVYVFNRDTNGNWVSLNATTPFYNGQSRDDKFGAAVAISGDTIAVGMPYEDPAKNVKNAGSVLLFKRSSDNHWNFAAEKQGTTDRIKGDLYGSSLAVEGDTLLVGAPMANGLCGGACGTVSVYSRNQGGADQWGFVTVIQASPRVGNEYFGKSVAISGSRIVVGASYPGGTGRAYVFNLSGNSASQVTKLTGTTAGGQFGASVAIDGNRVAVGQPYPTTSYGGVFMYEDANLTGNWQLMPLTQPLAITNPVAGDQLGAAVIMSGQTVIAGAPGRKPTGGANGQGAAYIFSYVNQVDKTYPPELDLDADLNGTGFLSTFAGAVAPNGPLPVAVGNETRLSITDVDSTVLTSATVKLTNVLDAGKEALSATNHGNVQAVYDTATNTLTLSPVTGTTAPLAEFVAVLQSVKYSNSSWVPNTTPRLVEFQVTDDQNNNSNVAVGTVFVVRSKQDPVITFEPVENGPYYINHAYTIHFEVSCYSTVCTDLAIPSGSVTIQMPGGPSCQGTLDATGNGTCSLTMTTDGDFRPTGSYSGDSNFNAGIRESSGFTFEKYKIFIPSLRKFN